MKSATLIEHATAAVERSADVRASLRRQTPPDRDERLRLALDELSEAMEPIRARLLHAPSLGRQAFEPDLRAASAAIQSERGKVRKMLAGKRGGSSTAQVPEQWTASRFKQAINGFSRAVKGLESEVQPFIDLTRRPARDPFSRLGTLRRREEAQELLAQVRAQRSRIRARERDVIRYGMWKRGRLTEYVEELLEQSAALCARLDALEAPLERRVASRPAKPRSRKAQPPRRKWRRWTADEVRAVLALWEEEHGRPVRARDLTDPSLPGLGTVQRLLGGLPPGRGAGVQSDRDLSIDA